MSNDLTAVHTQFSNMKEEPDVKPNGTGLDEQSTGAVQPKARKSPAKKGGRSVKDEVTGGATGGGFRPTSKDMAYHYVMHVLSKVTPETRREIAEKLGVKQKNLDASWSINWKKRVDQVLHDAFCK